MNPSETEPKNLQQRIFQEGMDLWKKQQEHARIKKEKEQKEMREMLQRSWPFGKYDRKPRRLRNLRLEELFPFKDYQNARFDTLDLGRPGGGAPIFSNGIKQTRTKVDPILRFQFGSKDSRRCVDNQLRYRTDKQEQERYKKELDGQVEEKHRLRQEEKRLAEESEKKNFLMSPPWSKAGPGGRSWRNPNTIGLNFLKSLGWSNEADLLKLKQPEMKKSEERKKTRVNGFMKLDPIPKKEFVCRKGKLSHLSETDNGVELVTLLAKDRRFPPRIPLVSTDITSEKKLGKETLWNRSGSAYLKELTQQVLYKQQLLKKNNEEEKENYQKHISTWNGFWGRPGNGAPNDLIKKQCLDKMLYPKFIPMAVH